MGDRTGWAPPPRGDRTAAAGPGHTGGAVTAPAPRPADDHVLDNPVFHALRGRQAHLGRSTPRAARFDPAVAPFGGLADVPTPSAWDDLAAIVGPGGLVSLAGDPPPPPPGWTVHRRIEGVQMVGHGVAAVLGDGPVPAPGAPDVLTLGGADVPDLLALVAAAQPGPFLPRTVAFGGYVGVRDGGRLVAMAGERLRPPGFAEISAVATDPDHRRRGLARRLVLAVAAGILHRGETPFLHASASNTGAIGLYGSIGFTLRRTLTFLVLERDAPAVPPG